MNICKEINQELCESYKHHTREFLDSYESIYHDGNMPSRINEFGIIDENRFNTNSRILVIAKETNGWSNEEFDEGILFRSWMEDITQHGLDGHDHIRKYPTMWYNIGRWIILIQHPNYDLATLSKEKSSAISAIGTVAFTNINKVRGNNVSGKAYRQIAYADIVGKVLRDELDIIKPNIVLCCGTFHPFLHHAPNYNGIIFGMPHPAARKSSLDMLNNLKKQILCE